jgi:hypothetical protein
MKALGALKKSLESGTATEAQIGEQLSGLKTIDADDRAKLAKDLEAIDAELTVVQQAKFRVLEHAVERRFFELMKRVITRPRPDREGRRPGKDGGDRDAPAPTKP